jgi:3-oxoacid CoA-transferase subunit A
LPSIYVNRLVLGAPYEKKIEFKTVREREVA